MTIFSFLKLFVSIALCLLAVGLSSCSYCWPSLHTADAVLHCDKQVVVFLDAPSNAKYQYKGQEWYPIRLAYAIDKGKDIYRRGDGCGWCIQDNAERYLIQQGSERICMIPCEESKSLHGSYMVFCFDRAVAEKDFPFSKAKRMEREKDEPLPVICKRVEFCSPYLEIDREIACMPITETPAQASMGQHIAAAPLQVVDCAATVAMCATETAVIIVLLPPSAVWNAIGKLING